MSHHYIEFKNVSYTYPNGKKALDGVNLHIGHGEKVALLGRNGAGKSTLMLHTNGLLLPSEGEVNIGGIPVTKKTVRTIRQNVGMVFQNPDDQLFMPTVEEDVAFGPLNMKLPPEEVERRVRESLESVGCLDLLKRSPMQLSGGQKRRVAIATVLSMEPSVLVMDEPTSNLDWSARENVMEILQKFMHTCLIATHDMGIIRKLCKRIIVLDNGKVLADGPTEEILSDNSVTERLGINPDELGESTWC